ncbi:hypothetical protein C206_23241 [Pseudomonas putida TRO1]|uniref:Uncharacterized protein n=1 Tax=Pseudomonas putida TRO1 TaxID=1227924 RepID=A0AAD2ZRN5_PSEPU|nr:hypothetical protein C206_23241 [Pseudomonas putida TRO1]
MNTVSAEMLLTKFMLRATSLARTRSIGIQEIVILITGICAGNLLSLGGDPLRHL